MALKPQSIRKNMFILVNGQEIPKEEIITMSELWTEKQESFFRKMLKQGGDFKVNNVSFTVKIKPSNSTRSDGGKDGGIVQIPGLDSKF